MSQQMKDMRSQMEEDENLKVLMASLRGQNLSDADFADENVQMRLVVVNEDGEGLPLEYDPAVIADFWGRRPVAVFSRIVQLLSTSAFFFAFKSSAMHLMRGEG
jgi:aarF domain-containing kinase